MTRSAHHQSILQSTPHRLMALALSLSFSGLGVGCATPPESTETIGEDSMSEEVGTAEQALNTCTMTSYLCGNDGLAGNANTLYRCGGSGQAATDALVCATTCAIKPNTNDWCNLGAANTVVASPTVMNILASGNYDSTTKVLQWAGSGALLGGSTLPLQPMKVGTGTRVPGSSGVGWCVDFVMMAAGRKNDTTSHWKKGAQVVSTTVKKGTVVATFNAAGAYSGHVGILAADVSAGASSITLYDQNFATVYDYLVRKHSLAKTNTGTVGDAGAYYVVNWQ